MRGAEGLEKSIAYGKHWQDLRRGHIVEDIMRTLRSLVAGFGGAAPPTLYSRFTFSVSGVRAVLSAGSPKLIEMRSMKLGAWFFASGLSYTLAGAQVQAEKAVEDIEDTISSADDGAQFLLEFVTCRAYQVKA